MTRVVHLQKDDEVKLTNSEIDQLTQLYNHYKENKTVWNDNLVDKEACESLIKQELALSVREFFTVTKRGQKVACRL